MTDISNNMINSLTTASADLEIIELIASKF